MYGVPYVPLFFGCKEFDNDICNYCCYLLYYITFGLLFLY